MKANWNKTELILFLLAFSLNWLALIADDYGYTSRNGFTLSRYIGSVVFVVATSILSHLIPLMKSNKITRFVEIYWCIASVTSLLAFIFIDSWNGETIWELLKVMTFGSATFLLTPFLVLLPIVQLGLSQWTTLGWMEIRTYHTIFVCCFSACQLLCIHRRELHQFYLNLPVHRVDG